LKNQNFILLNLEEKNKLLAELVSGSDPNSNLFYLFAILEEEEGLNFFKEYSKTEFSVENVI
jgi:hypothetical protein